MHRAAHSAGVRKTARTAGAHSGGAAARTVAVGAHGVAVARPSVVTASRSAAKVVLAVGMAVLVATGAGLGLASAGGTAMAPHADHTDAPAQTTAAQADLSATAALAQTSSRDVSGGVAEIAAEEEAARIAAEQAAKDRDAQVLQRVQAAQAKSAANGGVGVYAVDWSVGHDAFVSEWSARIDKYLAGSPLAGCGATFAEAAWNNGVDPRWSPAISNTESTKGRHCFASHNAWGWTNGAWGDWGTAINAHVRGLAEIYGYTISYANAVKYCPPNHDNWYRDTLNEMSKI